MSFTRTRDKPDAPTVEIVTALRAAGAQVHYARPLDLWVGWNGHWTAMEVKAKRGKLSEAQRQLLFQMSKLGLPHAIVRTPEEALRAIGAK